MPSTQWQRVARSRQALESKERPRAFGSPIPAPACRRTSSRESSSRSIPPKASAARAGLLAVEWNHRAQSQLLEVDPSNRPGGAPAPRDPGVLHAAHHESPSGAAEGADKISGAPGPHDIGSRIEPIRWLIAFQPFGRGLVTPGKAPATRDQLTRLTLQQDGGPGYRMRRTPKEAKAAERELGRAPRAQLRDRPAPPSHE